MPRIQLPARDFMMMGLQERIEGLRDRMTDEDAIAFWAQYSPERFYHIDKPELLDLYKQLNEIEELI